MPTALETSELFELLNVRFPRHVDFSELRSMLTVISNRSNCEIDYNGSFIGHIGGRDTESGILLPPQFYAKSVKGTFRRGLLDSANFQADLDNDYDVDCGPQTRATGIRFLITPGYDTVDSLRGRRTDSIEVMTAVREEIRNYFGL